MTRTTTRAALAGLTLLLAGCSTEADPATDRGVAERTSAQSTPSASTSDAPDAGGQAAAGPARPSGAERRQAAAAVLWGPTPREVGRAQRIAASMPLSHLAGQVIVARYPGTGAPTSLVNGLHLGGVIVMGDNVGSTGQVRASNRASRTARQAGRRWPVFIGVDQEGGIVERVQDRATRFPAFMTGRPRATPAHLGRCRGERRGALRPRVQRGLRARRRRHLRAGRPDDRSRSAGSSPRVVATQMNAAVDGYLSSGILPVIKHFPGHGSVPADSHLEMPVQDKSLRQLRRSDLVPFAAGVDGGVSSVMVAHIAVQAVDPARRPPCRGRWSPGCCAATSASGASWSPTR